MIQEAATLISEWDESLAQTWLNDPTKREDVVRLLYHRMKTSGVLSMVNLADRTAVCLRRVIDLGD